MLPWSSVLRDFIERLRGYDRHWSTPSRRHLARGIYLPGQATVPALQVTVVIDVSGSCDPVLPAFAAELQAIADATSGSTIHLLAHDSGVHDLGLFCTDRPLRADRLQLPIGGGTCFLPVLRHLASLPEAPRAVVWLTDGDAGDAEDFATSPAPPFPVLWALTDDGVRACGWGGELRFPPKLG